MKKQQRRNRLEEWINLSTYYLYFPIKLLRKIIIIIFCVLLLFVSRETGADKGNNERVMVSL